LHRTEKPTVCSNIFLKVRSKEQSVLFWVMDHRCFVLFLPCLVKLGSGVLGEGK
jgi:hypothetical protein